MRCSGDHYLDPHTLGSRDSCATCVASRPTKNSDGSCEKCRHDLAPCTKWLLTLTHDWRQYAGPGDPTTVELRVYEHPDREGNTAELRFVMLTERQNHLKHAVFRMSPTSFDFLTTSLAINFPPELPKKP